MGFGHPQHPASGRDGGAALPPRPARRREADVSPSPAGCGRRVISAMNWPSILPPRTACRRDEYPSQDKPATPFPAQKSRFSGAKGSPPRYRHPTGSARSLALAICRITAPEPVARPCQTRQADCTRIPVLQLRLNGIPLIGPGIDGARVGKKPGLHSDSRFFRVHTEWDSPPVTLTKMPSNCTRFSPSG